MKPGILFFVISDIKDYMVTNNMLRDDGTAIFDDPGKDIQLVGVVENSLKRHGVTTPDVLDKIVAMLPGFLIFFK